MESAIISLDGREYLMPKVPIEIPSLTPIVLNINPTYSEAEILFLILTDRSFKCMLQGLPS